MEISVILDLMFNMETRIKIFETNKQDGVLCKNKKFYDEHLSEDDIKQIFKETRHKLGEKNGFKGEKMFQANQKSPDKSDLYENGKYVVLDDTFMQKEDFWYEDIKTDILILEDKYKGIVVGHPMADCPILIIEDRKKGVTALSHCGASYIDRLLPQQTVEALIKEFNSNPEDLYAYIGSSAKKESYVYETYPKWANNKELWKDTITKEDDGYHIDLVTTITKQLVKMNIKNITISPIDTITNEEYYSHYASFKGKKDKFGQNFVGFFYK